MLVLGALAVLVVGGFVVGVNEGRGWKPTPTLFAGRKRTMAFRSFGIGTAPGALRQATLTDDETEHATLVESSAFDSTPRLSGGTPRVPRPVMRLKGEGTYGPIVSRFLAKRGVKVAKPRITGLYRADLDGDGTAEVIVVANSLSGPGAMGEGGPNAYGLVLLRAVRAGGVVEIPLELSLPHPQGFIEVKHLRGVADLDGDGRMEVVTAGSGFEWSGATLWGYRTGRATKLVENGAGH